MVDMLGRAGFQELHTYQAMIGLTDRTADNDVPVRPGQSEGAFVGIGAIKALS
jgi:hypothetical protein